MNYKKKQIKEQIKKYQNPARMKYALIIGR